MRYKLKDDTELLNLLRSNDSTAFEEIYLRYWKEIYLHAYQKTRNKELAEEITQNLFVNLWEKREEKEIINLRHYLFASVKFSVINYYKSQIVEEKYINYVKGSFNVKDFTTEELIALMDLSEAIEKGIALLPKKTKEVFELSRVENFTVKEISKSLNITEKAVEYHITRSLKFMKLYLKDYLLLFLFTLLISHLLN